MKKLKKYLKGFTLVELIIVITILAILATIAFVSFQNYTKDARDSSRVTTFSNLNNGFEIFFTKVGNYPQPDSPVSYTGGNTTIQMGIVGENVSKLIGVNTTPKDPLTNQNYIYSLGGNGYYYQIAGEKENTLSSIFTSVYAAGETKLPIVKGNYKMDPSLPSLIPVKTSITDSGIFDPNVCFITDGGSNNFASTNGNCVKKKDMSLKTLDSSLVGYWDMETCDTTNGSCTLASNKLKDLSGNGNDGIFSGGVLGGNTGGILGKGMTFSSGQYIQISNTGSELANLGKIDYDYSLLINVKLENYISGTSLRLIEKTYSTAGNPSYPMYLYYWNNGSPYLRNFIRSSNPAPVGLTYSFGNYENLSIFQTIYLIVDRKNKLFKMYVNGKLLKSSDISNLGDTSNLEDLIIGNDNRVALTNNWYGIIDDIKIYNRAIPGEEIAQQAKIAGF